MISLFRQTGSNWVVINSHSQMLSVGNLEVRHRKGQRPKGLWKPRFTQREVWRKCRAIKAMYKNKQGEKKEG